MVRKHRCKWMDLQSKVRRKIKINLSLTWAMESQSNGLFCNFERKSWASKNVEYLGSDEFHALFKGFNKELNLNWPKTGMHNMSAYACLPSWGKN